MAVCAKKTQNKIRRQFEQQRREIMKGEMSLSFFEIPIISPFDYLQFLYERGYFTRVNYEAIMSCVSKLCEDADVLDSIEFGTYLLDDIEVYRSRRFKDVQEPQENLTLLVGMMKYLLTHEKYRRR